MGTIVSLPSKVYFESVGSLKLMRGGLTMRSRYTGRRQAIVYPFAVWQLEATTIKMSGTDAAEWRAFLTSLDGINNSFRLPVPGTESGPLSGYTGSLAVGAAGAVAGATSMPVTGTAGRLVLKKGDFFTINDELKVAQADVTTDGGGLATVSFKPLLRSAVTVGMGLTLTNPTVLLAAVDVDSADWSLEVPVLHQFKLKCAEAF